MLQDLYCTFTALDPNCLHPDSSITGYLVTIRNDKASKRVSFYGSYEKCTSAANQLFTELICGRCTFIKVMRQQQLLPALLCVLWRYEAKTKRLREAGT